MDTQRRGFLFGKTHPVGDIINLPWLKSSANFYDNCTQCSECLKQCPEQIIVKTNNNYPSIDFFRGECTFCGTCADVCPQHLFITDKNVKPWSFIAEVLSVCLTYYQISCRNCQDSCPTSAIKFLPQMGKVSQPNVIASLCTGCGACVSPCANNAIHIGLKKMRELTKDKVDEY